MLCPTTPGRFSRENRIPTHLTREEKTALADLAAATPGGTFVEIGSYLGASACFIAAGIRRSGGRGRLSCVDTWENDAMTEGKRDTFREFIENTAAYREIVVPVRCRSVAAAAAFDRPVDFLFVDGDHAPEAVAADVEAWLPRLSPGATVAFHDVGWADGVRGVVDRVVAPLSREAGGLPNLWWGRLDPARQAARGRAR